MKSPRECMVFIVDDDVSMREALVSLLDATGIPAQCFRSAQEFLRHPRPGGPACLLLDVRLPGASGLDLQRELTRHGEEWRIPIIFMTAYGDVPTAVGAMKAGAVEFLLKPFTEQELLGAVERALEQDRAAGRRGASRHERPGTVGPLA
jgi:FixJ family two-component response regulator